MLLNRSKFENFCLHRFAQVERSVNFTNCCFSNLVCLSINHFKKMLGARTPEIWCDLCLETSVMNRKLTDFLQKKSALATCLKIKMRFETRTGFLFISIRNFRQLHPWTRNLLMTDHDAHTCDVCFSIWRPREYKDKRSLPLKHLHPRPCGSGISNSKTDTLWMTMDLWAQLPGYAGSVPSRPDKKESWIQQKCSLLSWQKESCVVPRCTCASERPCALRCFVPENLGRVGGNENAHFACEKMKKQIADKLF